MTVGGHVVVETLAQPFRRETLRNTIFTHLQAGLHAAQTLAW
jgi:hypothetical protein